MAPAVWTWLFTPIRSSPRVSRISSAPRLWQRVIFPVMACGGMTARPSAIIHRSWWILSLIRLPHFRSLRIIRQCGHYLAAKKRKNRKRSHSSAFSQSTKLHEFALIVPPPQSHLRTTNFANYTNFIQCSSVFTPSCSVASKYFSAQDQQIMYY